MSFMDNIIENNRKTRTTNGDVAYSTTLMQTWTSLEVLVQFQ